MNKTEASANNDLKVEFIDIQDNGSRHEAKVRVCTTNECCQFDFHVDKDLMKDMRHDDFKAFVNKVFSYLIEDRKLSVDDLDEVIDVTKLAESDSGFVASVKN
mmetsp:Transcript_21415/g.36575  ORF Transcript_21415/g.36575 Transcript_21415/m.36575 type:complete len:103 (-) Transcript_21415:28-336(-)